MFLFFFRKVKKFGSFFKRLPHNLSMLSMEKLISDPLNTESVLDKDPKNINRVSSFFPYFFKSSLYEKFEFTNQKAMTEGKSFECWRLFPAKSVTKLLS